MSCSLSQLGNTVYLPIETPPLGTELRWAPKDPNDNVFVTFDLTQYLLQTNDSLSAVLSAVTTPSDLIFTQTILTGTAVTWLASGGTFTNPPTDYYLQVQVLTILGQTITRKIYMEVFNLSLEWISGSPIAVLQGPPGPPPSAEQILAVLNELPSFTAGDPGVGNWWLNAAGNPQQGIVANISQISNPNLVLTLLASGAMG